MIRFENTRYPGEYLEYKMLNGFVMYRSWLDQNWKSSSTLKTLDDARNCWYGHPDWHEVRTAQNSSTPQTVGKPHLFIYKYGSSDMWCQYCNEEQNDWRKRGCPHDCPRRVVLQPIQQTAAAPVSQSNQQGGITGHYTYSSVSLGLDNCVCGGGVWLYDPYISKFNCVSCGKPQGNKDSTQSGGEFKSCYHEWVKYTGLSEQFEYCKICDEKRK